MWSTTKPNAPRARHLFAACVLPILVSLAACEKKPEATATATPAATDSAATATTVAELDYGYLGAPDTSDSDDPGSATRTPEKSLELFRKAEANPPQGTPDHPVDFETLKTNAEVQRVRFYAAAKAVPQLIAQQDWKWVRADEALLISNMCAVQDTDSSAPKVPKATCDAADAAERATPQAAQ